MVDVVIGFASTIASPATANTKQECSVQCVSIRWSVRVFMCSACVRHKHANQTKVFMLHSLKVNPPHP